MQTKIAVICSASFQQTLQQIVPSHSTFLLDYYTYTVPEETPSLLKNLKSCDVLLLSGTLPYLYAKEQLSQLSIPWMYLKQDDTSIATTLLSLLVQKNIALNRLSIDVMDERFIEHVLCDLQTTKRPFIQTIQLHTPYETYITKHVTLWQQQQIDYVVTSIHAVYDALVTQGVPVMRMIDPQSAILRGLYEAKSLSDYAKSESAKIAVIHILFDYSPPAPLLQQMTNLFSSIYQQLDAVRYEFYTTNGAVQRHATELLQLLQTQQYKIGFGYGHSISQAQEHAKQALKFGQPQQFMVVDEQKKLYDLTQQTGTSIALQTTHPFIFEITKATGLSPKNISRLVAFEKVHPHTSFTAQDLADYLQVTRRTTERMLKKLLAHEYVEIVGEEMAYQQGRPRAVYTLTFSLNE
ncbi:hypothetical protein [Caryophanon tenue]|uniref:Helix-turn-helix type 11 domain-containing protein n=1 Tax=Caryophanon tenue TaxID=33978 RepID=A0A1C0Y898_9BACL|nr:hypothetical protein [Caryophanon tenue]OCS83353.1 hypothetical protein A6M13_04835 [Caryophanon tenue]